MNLTSRADGPLAVNRDAKGALHGAVRVGIDGTIERGIDVPREVTYMRSEPYVNAAPPHSAKHQRFAPSDRLPVSGQITVPHDCANHLPEASTESFGAKNLGAKTR